MSDDEPAHDGTIWTLHDSHGNKFGTTTDLIEAARAAQLDALSVSVETGAKDD